MLPGFRRPVDFKARNSFATLVIGVAKRTTAQAIRIDRAGTVERVIRSSLISEHLGASETST
jgi:hypothetical protein